MSESERIDARWQRERRRVGIRSGLSFGLFFLVLKVIERSGVLSRLFGAWGVEGGPFTIRWGVLVLISSLLAAAIFGFAIQWTVKPPSERATGT